MRYWANNLQVNIKRIVARTITFRGRERQKNPRQRQALLERKEIEIRKELKEINERPFELLGSDDVRRRVLRRELSRLSRSPILT